MARDILSEYGPDYRSPQKPAASSGGVMSTRDVRNYSPPQGPTNINDRQSPGLHGNNFGNCGSQGGYATKCETSGSPGLGGMNKGMGTNRRG